MEHNEESYKKAKEALYSTEQNEKANQKAKETVVKFLSEGFEMMEAVSKAQWHCAEMTVKDKQNSLLWAMAGVYCSIAIYRLDGNNV